TSQDGKRRTPLPDVTIKPGDKLSIEGEPDALDRIVEQGGLTMASERRQRRDNTDLATIEAIIGPNSVLIGRTARDYALFERTGLNLLAVSRREKRFSERLSEIRFEPGDVVLLR